MVSSHCFKNIQAQNCPGLTKSAISDKDSNKHGVKATVLFNKLSHQLKLKKKKIKKGNPTHILVYSKIRCHGLHSLKE